MRDVPCSLMKPYCKVYQNNYSYFFNLWIIYFNYTYATYEYIVLIFSFSFSYFSTLSVVLASMVTHTQNLCSAFNPYKVHTHTAVNTHTPWTHTRSSGKPFMLRRPGSSRGFSVLLKSTSVVVLKEERALDIHSPPPPTYNLCWTWDSNSQPFDYESDSLIIRPRLPTIIYS